MNRIVALAMCLALVSCGDSAKNDRLIPAQEFSKAMRNGSIKEFTLTQKKGPALGTEAITGGATSQAPTYGDMPAAATMASQPDARAQFSGDSRYLEKGLVLKNSLNVPSPQIAIDGGAAYAKTATSAGQHPYPPAALSPAPPPGSSAPYYKGQMTANPSLFPDEAQGAYLFSDIRGFQAMDIITILIDEDATGKKKAETNAESSFSLLAAIENFFGLETTKWERRNPSLDPKALINAETDTKFEGKAKSERTGTLRAEMSAVVMEVFPNGLMRIEGTKILSMDSEEETMVLTGLIRPRDVNSKNQVESSRIANMRIDFYGQGVLGDQQTPGWGARAFEVIWPF